MAKATKSQLIDLGFQATQFGTPADWGVAAGYLDRVLAPAAAWARQRIGGTLYDAMVDGDSAYLFIARAETFRAAAELWRRRAVMIDSSAVVGNREGQFLERREYLAHAEAADAQADLAIADAQSALAITPTYPGSGMAFGYVEHGNFPVMA